MGSPPSRPVPTATGWQRQLLDAAWDRYPALVPKLAALEQAAEDEGRASFDRINELLETGDAPIHSRLILYVGQFDNNAFTMPSMDGKPVTVLMPVENAILKIALAHELTHSVHIQLAHVQNSFGAPVGETMFLEGLAMRTSQAAVPGLPETAYTQIDPNDHWLATCYAKQDAVLKDIVPDLDKSGQDDRDEIHLRPGQQRHAARGLLRGLDRDGQAHRLRPHAPRSRAHPRRQDGRHDPRGDELGFARQDTQFGGRFRDSRAVGREKFGFGEGTLFLA